jgi:predicted amidohydrolase YtcJ
MRLSYSILIALFIISCTSEKPIADLLVKNAMVYTVNDQFETAEAFTIKDGRIQEVGNITDLENKYTISESYDAKGKAIYPGFIDAHAHLYKLGQYYQNVELIGTSSFDEVLDRIVAFQKEKNVEFIEGRGWDQNDWEIKKNPTKKELDSLFPNTPVVLKRIDGHAYLANSKAMELAGITGKTKLPGGEVILENGEPIGILIDKPMDLINNIIPEMSKKRKTQILIEAEKVCLEFGLTTVVDAGLDRDVIELIDSLQKNELMSIRIYAMVSNKIKNLEYFLEKGIYKTQRLNVRSIKIYADGALGSRGAALREEYSDKPGHFGAMVTPIDSLMILANRIASAGYQMNTHAIGDSANISVLKVYQEVLKNRSDPRWRVEHAQIVTPADFDYFSGKILPSIQPTHATSDMYWAEDRVGPHRIKGAYSFKTLLNKSGIVALGTDFPVERVNPMYTFYAAVARKDLDHYPDGGYRIEEGLTREETLKGMTIWAAYSNFEENEKGSIEAGKFADFVILDQDIMTIPEDEIPNVKVLGTYIDGKKVY